MARIIAIENVTLDGVMQAPAAPDEDTRGGFAYGGWGQPYGDEISMQKAREGMASEGAMLFGRVTYERFLKVWAGREDNPFSPVLDARHKYVVSTTLTEPLAWQNSTLVGGAPEPVSTVAVDPYCVELERFAAAVRDGGEPPLGRADALGQARTIAALYRSAEEGRAVSL